MATKTWDSPQMVVGKHNYVSRIVIYSLLAIAAVVYLVPLLVMLLTSFKPLPEVYSGNILALPHEWTLAAWEKAWGSACVGLDCSGVKGFFWNSFRMVFAAVGISTLLGALNGYVLTKWRFRGDNLLFGLILFGCFIPFQIVLIPMASFLGKIGLAQSITGLVFVHVVYGLCFTTLYFRNYYVAFPDELVKAAMIDGARFFRIFFRILLPNSVPIITVTVIWQFTNIWNDFLFGASFTTGSSAPITVALNNIVNTSTGVREYNVHMATAMIAALPTLFVYIVGGRYFVRGLMAGSVKG
ncbi:ABC transporter permease subunit [Paraburkholderia sp. CNPSo 3157]|uniref:ABC transporter permease subunit n=2 Tax=Paraburkholderia franconis TaxID=2654983 RepID=A0A7X1NJG1_9BURK|nr:ABC transporter permease subunit [Paraburkholderia franconis]